MKLTNQCIFKSYVNAGNSMHKLKKKQVTLLLRKFFCLSIHSTLLGLATSISSLIM